MLIERSSAFDLSSPSEAASQCVQHHLIAKRPNLNTLVHVCVPFQFANNRNSSTQGKKKKKSNPTFKSLGEQGPKTYPSSPWEAVRGAGAIAVLPLKRFMRNVLSERRPSGIGTHGRAGAAGVLGSPMDRMATPQQTRLRHRR